MQTSSGKHLKNLSSIAFGGDDLKTVYLGTLGGDRVRLLSLAGSRSPACSLGVLIAGAGA